MSRKFHDNFHVKAKIGEESLFHERLNLDLEKPKKKIMVQEHDFVDGITPKEIEMTRLVLQWMEEHGYKNSKRLLERESGIAMEPDLVSKFKKALLSGDWDCAGNILPKLIRHDCDYEKQQFMEKIQAKEMGDAITILQNVLTKLIHEPKEFNILAKYILHSNTLPKCYESRSILLDKLSEFISPNLLIPKARLEKLTTDGVAHQLENCYYHLYDEGNTISLLSEHNCENRSDFPNKAFHKFNDHNDEIWYVSFSNRGQYLASASKDTKVHVYKSPKSGEIVHQYRGHQGPVLCCAWMPDGTSFLSCSLDMSIILWNIDGSKHHIWTGLRVTDVCVLKDGLRALFTANETKIILVNLENFEFVCTIQESDSISSLKLSGDSSNFLVNLASQEIHLWNIEQRKLVSTYVGHKQGRYVVRSCFGGKHENFILSGSEVYDNKVYVWNKKLVKCIDAMEGHQKT
ncbi:WD40 repeat-like protein, partial [Rozella allomycis CSF55]